MSRKFRHRRLKPVLMFKTEPISAQHNKIFEELEEMQAEYSNVERKLISRCLKREELKRLELELLDLSGAAQMLVYILNANIGKHFGLDDEEVYEELHVKNDKRGYYDPPEDDGSSLNEKLKAIAEVSIPVNHYTALEKKTLLDAVVNFFKRKEG